MSLNQLFPFNGFLEIFNMGTAFDDNWKDSFACSTQNPAPQLDLVGRGHIPWTCVDGCVET